MSYKSIIGYLNCENELETNILKTVEQYSYQGADALYLYNYSTDEATREEFLATLKKVSRIVDIPFWAGMYVTRFEDIKKVLYTGAERVVIKESQMKHEEAVEEGIRRFGTDKVMLEADSYGDFKEYEKTVHWKELGVCDIILKHVVVSQQLMDNIKKSELPIIIRDSLVRNSISDLIFMDNVDGVATNYYREKDIMKAKLSLKEQGASINTFESSLAFSDFKLNRDGMIPVVTQDYKTNEVLMVAYMNEEAFNQTVVSGKMTYWSRSRDELWCKGDTSGHVQYVKELLIDCDNDTILAKVRQVGAACHTGNRSCFFTQLVKREYDDTNPLTVLNDVYQVIMDRKLHPKEGSYTNYLFDKGIDKILKKCGEEATEIVIAAKNPDAEELKYEISDFLYHMMVLMAECDLDWNDIIKELAHRR